MQILFVLVALETSQVKIACDFDEHWKISRFIESLKNNRGSGVWWWWPQWVKKWKEAKNSTGQQITLAWLLFWAPFVSLLSHFVTWLTALSDWLTVFVWKLRDGSLGCVHTFPSRTSEQTFHSSKNNEQLAKVFFVLLWFDFLTMTAKLFSVHCVDSRDSLTKQQKFFWVWNY